MIARGFTSVEDIYDTNLLSVWRDIKKSQAGNSKDHKPPINEDNLGGLIKTRLTASADMARNIDEVNEDLKKIPLEELREMERKSGKNKYLHTRKVTIKEIDDEIKDYPEEEKELLTKLEPDEARSVIDNAKNETEIDNPGFFDKTPEEEPVISEQIFNTAQNLNSLREVEKREEY